MNFLLLKWKCQKAFEELRKRWLSGKYDYNGLQKQHFDWVLSVHLRCFMAFPDNLSIIFYSVFSRCHYELWGGLFTHHSQRFQVLNRVRCLLELSRGVKRSLVLNLSPRKFYKNIECFVSSIFYMHQKLSLPLHK